MGPESDVKASTMLMPQSASIVKSYVITKNKPI